MSIQTAQFPRSGMLQGATYDDVKKELRVTFKSNPLTVYTYSAVPPSVWTKLSTEKSAGGFFASDIKNKYTHIKHTTAKTAPSCHRNHRR